jgi:Tol biopolymer transport system component
VPGDTNDFEDVFVHDRKTGTTQRVSVSSAGTQGNHHSAYSGKPAISSGGRFVAFISQTSNLVPGDINNVQDVFVHDRQTGTTERVGSFGIQHDGRVPVTSTPAISRGGRFVAFFSATTNLVPGDTNGEFDVFVRSLAP